LLENKRQCDADVVASLNQLAENEADLILRRQREAGGSISYTEISARIRRDINSNYALLTSREKSVAFSAFRRKNAFLHSLPRMIRDNKKLHATD